MLQSARLTDVARCNPQPDSLFMNDLKTDLPGKVVFLKTGDGRRTPASRQESTGGSAPSKQSVNIIPLMDTNFVIKRVS